MSKSLRMGIEKEIHEDILLAARNLAENIGKGKGNGKGEDKPTRSRAMRYLK